VYVTDTGIAAMGGTHSGHPHRVPVGRFAAANHELLILRDAELMSRRIVHDLQEKSKALLEIAKKSAVEVPSYLFESRKYRHYSMLREFEGTKTSFELEAAFATTICFAGMIDDRVANLALRLRELSADAAWSGVNLDKNGKAAKGTMAARTAARANLHNGFGNSNPLKKLQNLRNNLIHATNYYCFAELENEDILFSPSFELEQVSPDNDGLELLSEFTKNISILFESYLRWFLDECERQTKGLTN
jgi:hypothetical protein